FYELLDAETLRDGWKHPRVSWSNYWSPDPAVWRVQAESARAPRITPSERPSGARRMAPIIPSETDEDFDDAWVRLQGRGGGAWHWWVAAAAAVVTAIVLGVHLGLRPAPTPIDTPPQPVPVAAPEPRVQAVRQAIDEYRSRETLVAPNCVTFQPTAPDRAQLRAAGADDAVPAALDECLRARLARAAPRPPPPPPPAPSARPRAPAPARPSAPPPAPLPVVVSPPATPIDTPAAVARAEPPPPPQPVISERLTQFARGVELHGRVGSTLGQVLVLEVR